ncbi:hypothetical protein TTHERM_01106190 (macronuclear) [Tetrahymena thermophila SB210]|uniref:Uncharacterized protein n=1 Tax=Tetrahymena thermophila (strain SB210) TaxID=312017 RepID=Q22BD8_TETTS|nr:hypothetical protein TTHERM_01106190 [Tetrahymena thermophila SB210]EAR82617.2 hypothetical protein TTHERM_01106190 [Tetrahymena thermophila SB210]|eukprot:XP_001030280.2 hypothetical protein TTHERM_01106190 [Tetrahymena thermophila SB210]
MKNSFSLNLQNSKIKNSSIRPLQSLKEETKLSTLKLNNNGNSQSVKRINILEFKQNVQKELEIQKKKLEEMQKRDFQPITQEYFSNVYGPLTNKVNYIKQLRSLMQRNKDFDEAHFAIGCPCFHHGQKKNKLLFADQSWFNGITQKPQEREMMPSYLDAMVSDIYDDIPIDEGILVGEVNCFPVKKKKGKINMLRERFNEVLIDENYPDIEKIYKIMGQINKPTKGKIVHFSMFEIEAGEIINFEFENKGVLSGKQYHNKIDYQEMSQFYLEITFLEKDNVQDVLSSSRPSSASSGSDMSTQLSSSSGFCRKKQSHFQLQLKQKYRHTQFSYDAIEAMRQLKLTDPLKLYRILTTYDPVYQESIISLSIIIRDMPLMNFLFTEIFTDQNLISNQGFFKYASIEIFNGFQKVSFRFEKDKKFFLELQKRLIEQQNIQLSEFFFIKDKKLDYTPTYGSDGNQFSLILRQRSKSYSAILSQFCDFKNLSELEFSSKIFEKLMIENQQNIDNVDLGLEYFRDLYFNKFVLPDKFENNKFQSIYFGNSKIAGGRKLAKQNNSDIRYHNILHNYIENKQNLDDIIRRYDETFVLFSQKDMSGNTPGQLLFKRASSDQILEYIKQAGQDQVKELMNDLGENILHSLYLNTNLMNSEEILALLGQDIVNQLKNQKNNQGQYPLIYFLKRNIKRIRFSTLNLLLPTLREQGDSIQFIRNELLPIINSCSLNSEVMQFLMNKKGSFQIIYKYPPAIAKFFDMKPIYERLMQNLFDDQYHLMQGYQYMNQKQLLWVIEKDRSLIHKMMKMTHPVYDWYVRKRQEGDTQYQDISVLVNKNQKIKKKQAQQNIIKLSLIKYKLRDHEILKSTEPLPKNSTFNLNHHEIKWSNKILYPQQDREISKYFSRLLTKNQETGQYSAFKFDDYQVQKFFFCNLENYHAKKHLLFEKLKKLDKSFIFHFNQTHSNKNSEFILDLDKLGFFAIVEIKARPFVRYMEDQPSIQKQKWFQTKEEFKKLMIQKHCNHLTNIPFQMAREDSNITEFKKLLERLSKSKYMADSLLELFLYHIIEGSASENLRALSEYYFDLNSFLRWCRELRVNPSTSMIQVILDQNLIPHNKLVQMLCFRRYNHKLIEQNILANLDINQIQITEEKQEEKNNKSDGQKKKLKVSQLLFDIICVKAKVKNFTKSYEWAKFIIESSLSNKSRMSKQNKRYIFSQNWPDLWMKLQDPNTHAGVLYFELNKKLKEKKQYKTNSSNSQQQNNKSNQQGETQSILITNKDYFKKCIEVLSSKIKNSILARIIMICIELGKPKWGQKLFTYSSVHQYQIFQLLRFYNINLLQYKLLFQQQSFISKDKIQNSQIEDLKYIVYGKKEAFQILKKLEKNEQYGQIQQWIQRVSEEYRYQLAHFFIMRYLYSLLVGQENSASRKQIRIVHESLNSDKHNKKQQEYSQKLEQLMEKSQKRPSKFKKEHSYNLLNHKEEANKEKYGYYKVKIPQNKSLKVLFGSPVLLNTNQFQIEQLFDTCLELYYSKDDFYVRNNEVSYKQFLKNYKAMKNDQSDQSQYDYLSKRLQLPLNEIQQYLYQRPDKVIGILQKMKYQSEDFIKYLFRNKKPRRCKKFNENIEYLSSKLIIKEYISAESAELILSSCLKGLYQFNNNQIISSIVKNFGKEILFQKMKELTIKELKNILPIYLIEYKNWMTKEDQKQGTKKPNNSKKQNLNSELELKNLDQAPERQQSQSKDKENQEEFEIEYQENNLYHIVLIELAQREAQRLRIIRQFKKQQIEGNKIQEISQFQNDLLNFELANVITERDLSVKFRYQKSDITFGEYILQKGLLIKGDQVDERLIQFIQSNSSSKIYILKSQDPLYAKIVFDKLYQGKRSLVEEFMDQSKLFHEMIIKGYKEDFIEKMISYYYRKSSDSIKLVELSIQNNMQKIFFSLIRSESDRNQIKQTIQNQYQYIKAFRHYDIANFAINELEIQQFSNFKKQHQKSNQNELTEQDQVQSDDDQKTFLLEIENANWLSMKLLLAQENQLEKFNKTQKMFIMLKNLLLENLTSLPSFLPTQSSISIFEKLSELVFDRSKLKNYSSELAIIQSEILKNQILQLPESLEGRQIDFERSLLDSLYNNKLVTQQCKYSSPYDNSLKQILIKPYQVIYWLKYRHGQSTLNFAQAKEEEFILKVKDIVNKFGPLQIEFNAIQMKLGVQNEVWLYNEIIRNLEVHKDEHYLYELANLLNPMNSTFSYFMFNIAIYNTDLFIKLIPKLKQIFTDQQIEELLQTYIKIHLQQKVDVEQIQLTEYLQNFITPKAKNISRIQSQGSNKQDVEQKDNKDIAFDSPIQEISAIKQKQDQPNEDKILDDAFDQEQDFSQSYFQDLKNMISEYQNLYGVSRISKQSGQPIKLSVPLEFQNAFIILIKYFNSNLYSKILCDTLTSLDNSSILSFKIIVFILDHASQNIQAKCIKQLASQLEINIKNCNDIRQFEQIAYFYDEHVSKLLYEPYNVKRIEIIIGSANKYQYFSSQNMILTINYINIQEFQSFIFKEFEFTKSIQFMPFDSIKFVFNLKVSSKNFGSSQSKTQIVNEYFEKQFQQEIHQEEYYFRNWCQMYALMQNAQLRNYDIVTQSFIDRPKTDQEYDQIYNDKLGDEIDEIVKQKKEQNLSKKKKEKILEKINKIGTSLYPREVNLIAKEIQSSEYAKLLSPYERIKNMQGQLYLEKEMKNENTYFVYFYFENNKTHIINTFYLTNIYLQKILDQNQIQSSMSLNILPIQQPLKFIRQFDQENGFSSTYSDFFYDFDFEISEESINLERNQNLANIYCTRYLKYEIYIGLSQRQSFKDKFKQYIKREFKIDNFKIKFICIDGNQEQANSILANLEQDQQNETVKFGLIFDFSSQPIKVVNSLFKQYDEYYQIDNSVSHNQPAFLTQFNSVFDIYRHYCVIDFISYFNTLIMNCSQLKLMYSYIPSQIQKAIQIVYSNAQKYGFNYVLFKFTTTNQPFNLKSDCFKDHSDKIIRLGQTTYEVSKPLEDNDSQKFKLPYNILKVTLSLAFKHPTKEFTTPEKKDDDIEHYFFKIANEYELIKAVCQNRDIFRKIFQEQNVDSSKSKKSKNQKKNSNNIEAIASKQGSQNGDEIDESKSRENAQLSNSDNENLAFNLQKLDQIIPQIFENNLKNQNDLYLYYNQVFQKIKEVETYFLLYKNVDLDNYRQIYFDEIYNKYLLDLIVQQKGKDLKDFSKLKAKARKWVEQNTSQVKKEFQYIINQPIKPSSQQAYKFLTYQFNKNQTFQVLYPSQKVYFSLIQSKIMEFKKNINLILSEYNVMYKGEDKWNLTQWNTIFDSSEGLRDANNLLGYEKLLKQHKIQTKQKNTQKKSKYENKQIQNIDIEDIQKLQLSNYFSNIQLVFTEVISNNNQNQEKEKKQNNSDNVKVQFKYQDESTSKENKTLVLESISTSQLVRQDTTIQVLRSILNEIKNDLSNQVYSPQQENNRQKVMRITVMVDQKQEQYKFKKKVFEMNQQELLQVFYFITLINYYKKLANQVKKSIKLIFQTGLKKPIIQETQSYFKIKMSTFQTINMYQLIIQDSEKPRPKCGLYSINCLTYLKTETVSDITTVANWSLELLVENQNKFQIKTVEVKQVEIDPQGKLKFQFEESLQLQPIYVKFIYKKQIVAAYLKKQENNL